MLDKRKYCWFHSSSFSNFFFVRSVRSVWEVGIVYYQFKFFFFFLMNAKSHTKANMVVHKSLPVLWNFSDFQFVRTSHSLTCLIAIALMSINNFCALFLHTEYYQVFRSHQIFKLRSNDYIVIMSGIQC